MKTRIIQDGPEPADPEADRPSDVPAADVARAPDDARTCLLYTSDAADEL